MVFGWEKYTSTLSATGCDRPSLEPMKEMMRSGDNLLLLLMDDKYYNIVYVFDCLFEFDSSF